MKLSAQAILILHAIVTVSLQQPTVGRHSRSVREEAIEDIDGSGLKRPLLDNGALSDDFPQDHSEVVTLHSDTPNMQDPLLIDIKYVADEETQVASLQDENLSTTEIHHLNVPGEKGMGEALSVRDPGVAVDRRFEQALAPAKPSIPLRSTRVITILIATKTSTDIDSVVSLSSYTEFLVVNVSLPIHANDLISRLVNAANKASYNEKLDIARRLTSFTHELMSSIEENLANAMLI
ncbi:hypothetical protein RB195_000145 [Necator americanus]|uniref:Uncharacterized protein n=1 Tax=Necator americanus TaxID=51031 RepID=A0ABR1D8B2_NECAM